MANNFYLGQIIIGFVQPDNEADDNKLMRRIPLNLGEKFIQNHSNLLLSPQPKDKTWEVQIAWLQTHNVFFLNLALILEENGNINFERLHTFARDTLAPLKRVGQCHPFIRIYIVGHGDIGWVDLSYLNGDKRVRLHTFANIISTILISPNGIYGGLLRPRVRASPLQFKISILACYSSSGIDPHTHTPDENALYRTQSIAGRLNDLLKTLPIPHVIAGRVHAMLIAYTGKKAQYSNDAHGMSGEQLQIDPKLRHMPAMKKLHSWDPEKGTSVRDAEYDKPSFLTKPFFGKIYSLLIMLQEELSKASKPKLFKDMIYDILEILDQIPLHAEEDMNTCLAVNMYLKAYAAEHADLIDKHSNPALSLLKIKTNTRMAFDRILSFFSR